MAVDWTKIRTNLYRDPKVCVMADLLSDPSGDLSRHVARDRCATMCVTRNVMRNACVGALVSVWGELRHRGKRDGDDLVIKGATHTVIDDIGELPGLGNAMLKVEWAVETADSLVFPNFFEEFNVDPTDQRRRKNTERQARLRAQKRLEQERDKGRDVARDTERDKGRDVAHREEESREENNKDKRTPLPPLGDPPFSSPEFLEAWNLFATHRKQKRETLTPSTASLLYKKFEKIGEARAIAGLLHTIEKGWTGFREPDTLPGARKPVLGQMEANHADADAAKERMRKEEAEKTKRQGEIFDDATIDPTGRTH